MIQLVWMLVRLTRVLSGLEGFDPWSDGDGEVDRI